MSRSVKGLIGGLQDKKLVFKAVRNLDENSVVTKGDVRSEYTYIIESDQIKDSSKIIGRRLKYSIKAGKIFDLEDFGLPVAKELLEIKYNLRATKNIKAGEKLNASMFEKISPYYSGMSYVLQKGFIGLRAGVSLNQGEPVNLKFISKAYPQSESIRKGP